METEAPPVMKKVFLETLGCQSNVLESDHVVGMLRKDGFLPTSDESEADVILFNTCSIRSHAEDKVFSRLGRLSDWKRQREGRVIGVLGCMATSYKERILERAPQVDLVVGPDQYPKVPRALREASGMGVSQVLADFDPAYFPENDPAHLSQPHRAFLEIMKGCDKFCTFCVVPFTRGREVSRPAEDILAEAKALAGAGVVEIMLLGQNVNSYGLGLKSRGKTPTFPWLLRELDNVKGIRRIRFMTSHPLDLSDDLIETMAGTPSVCESFHLPVQCGSDVILKRMGRKYDLAHYLDRVRSLRSRVRDLFLTTDLIVGFPGETEEDFQGTLRLLEEVRYDAVYSFKYSPRLGTPAARMLGQVPEDVKDERLARLNELAWRHAAGSSEARVGKVEEVLAEGPADRTPGAFFGKTRQNRTVVFAGRNFSIGEFVQVKVESAKVANLYGTALEGGRG
jgi:tRNA-2-methylthio-N6-dimethylallyladenosine synthase